MKGSIFTLLLEAMNMLLVKERMSLSGAGRMVDQDSRVIGLVIERYIDQPKKEQMFDQVEVLGFDEISMHMGHKYLCILIDSKRKKVLGVGLGKGKEAVLEGLEEIVSKRIKSKIKICDLLFLSILYLCSFRIYPEFKSNFNEFHLEQLLLKAVDTVRKKEQLEVTEF